MHIKTLQHTVDSAWSEHPSSLTKSWDSSTTLILAFGDSSLLDDATPLEELARSFPHSILMGCSTAGEILNTKIDDLSVSVAISRFDSTSIRKASAPLASIGASYAAGAYLAESLKGDNLKTVFVLSEGLTVNGSELVRGINDGLPSGVIVTGGLAGDGDRFARTWVIDGDQPVSGRATAIGLYGDKIRIGHGSKGGWDRFGPERKVTRCEGNVLFELDGKPALDLYKEYLGEMASGLPATGLRFPLALRADADTSKQLVRTILAVDEERRSMTFAGDIPKGYLAQLMRANFDQLIEGAEDAAKMSANRGSDGQTTLAIAISCVGRRMVLGEGSEEEIETTMDMLPEGTHQIGFYSYGELSPFASGTCDLHNQTMTLTTFHED